ncbi:MAG: peptide chain release factor N(5)-glutamine methyltransferase [Bacteroides sp.]|nr:peptide chain release factor N(5)-glutamine methyltransferase [Bacteroides sp.]
MRTLGQLREDFRASLSETCGRAEADALFYWAAQEILHQDRMRLAAGLPQAVPEQEDSLFASVLTRLQAGEPIQYIFGKAYFLDLELEVNPAVLIPRGETEELVLWTLENIRGIKNPKILDLCTGSGAIALALASARPDAGVWAYDISPEALRTASRNNERCRTRVNFFLQDILQEEIPENIEKTAFNLIVSNPPYVRKCERAQMRANVLEHEPHIALFVDDDDPLLFYRRIAFMAWEHLAEGGFVMAEINEAFPDECRELYERQGFSHVEVRRDLHGRARMLSGCKIASKTVSSRS